MLGGPSIKITKDRANIIGYKVTGSHSSTKRGCELGRRKVADDQLSIISATKNSIRTLGKGIFDEERNEDAGVKIDSYRHSSSLI